MNKENFDKAVENLKKQDINYMYIVDLTLIEILKFCKAWSMTPTEFILEDSEIDSPWHYVRFDINKLRSLAEVKKPSILESLIKANIIYPDGTYNEAVTIIKEAKDARRINKGTKS